MNFFHSENMKTPRIDIGLELLAEGARLSKEKKWKKALAVYVHLQKDHQCGAIPWNNAAWCRSKLGDIKGASTDYSHALILDPNNLKIRKAALVFFLRACAVEDACSVLSPEYVDHETSQKWLLSLLEEALRTNIFDLACAAAEVLSCLLWTGERHGYSWDVRNQVVTRSKLIHDLEQCQYLLSQGIVSDALTSQLQTYSAFIQDWGWETESRLPLAHSQLVDLLPYYNRIFHKRAGKRIKRALSPQWTSQQVEERFLRSRPGVVIIDNFLTPEALQEVRAFCMESTVWRVNRYARGRLGAFIGEGFCSPLLFQIAEELKERLPNVIKEEVPLSQMWAFKYENMPSRSTVHADFASVNVNLWITPDEANLDRNSGGLLVYDVAAPMEWSFATYNEDIETIRPYLEGEEAREYRIPYRFNRAVIFDSDLFHSTDEVNFGPKYEDRRMNVTWLFGTRDESV